MLAFARYQLILSFQAPNKLSIITQVNLLNSKYQLSWENAKKLTVQKNKLINSLIKPA